MVSEARNFIVGTRGSTLALAQSLLVSSALAQALGDNTLEELVIVTTGDKRQGTADATPRDKHEWIAEIEQALIDSRIDFAVHSAKDVPVDIHPETSVIPVLRREVPGDLLICSNSSICSIMELPQNAVIGTASLRRRSQLLWLRPDLQIKELRGNVPTRLAKLVESKKLDAIVLAEAGIRRLKIEPRASARLSSKEVLPAVNQGILLVQYRRSDLNTLALLGTLVDRETETCCLAERAFVHALNADCRSAVGVLAEQKFDSLHMKARVLAPDGSQCLEAELLLSASNPERIGEELAHQLLGRGAAKLLRLARPSEDIPD